MLQLFSRLEFEQAVVEHRAERPARGFSGWGRFVAMLFCHLGVTISAHRAGCELSRLFNPPSAGFERLHSRNTS
jgi:hypothetical protein